MGPRFTSHTKVIALGIICLGLIMSVAVYKSSLFAPRQANAIQTTSRGLASLSSASTTDWQTLLAQNSAHILPAATDTVDVLTGNDQGTASNLENGITAQLSRAFFSLYLQDEKNGVTIDNTEAQNIADKALSSLPITNTARQYTEADIHIIDDISPAAKQTYNQSLSEALALNRASANDQTLNIVLQATQSNSASDIAKLDPIINGYQKIIAATLKIPVPRDAVGLHIVYLNILSNILTDLQNMRQLTNDPTRGYIGFTNYQHDVAEFVVIIGNYSKYFQ